MRMTGLSPNAQAILLLTAPLGIGRDGPAADLVTPGEYKRLARLLLDVGREPADLLGEQSDEVLLACRAVLSGERGRRLLQRGLLLAQAVERWRSRAIWVVSRADEAYPRRLRARLREGAPPVLYGCGDAAILESGGLAVVGSRNADGTLIAFAESVGRIAAQARKTVVSGGARGIDQAAMGAALEHGGRVVGVLSDNLERAALNADNRGALLDGQLVLVSPYDPGAGFTVGNAMGRNKLVYALADVALVVNADLKKGGTWAGATEQLDRLRLVPIYARSTGEVGSALDALRRKGALPWPNPTSAEQLDEVFQAPPLASRSAVAELALTYESADKAGTMEPPAAGVRRAEAGYERKTTPPPAAPVDELWETVRAVARQVLVTPKTAKDFAAGLGVLPSQAKVWLDRLVAERLVERRMKPVRYCLRAADLFDDWQAAGGQRRSGST
jgi:DNA processing protein